ncbi:class I SAM-dependent methyltransferase [Micromonospora sp. NPDC020750]|uniref:class I SAM-dependent methyltransferase n=1 Tax=unclassified Micromonospora TaxID=2617518 RepID=UPI00378B972F
MEQQEEVTDFYDSLAPDYELLYSDWEDHTRDEAGRLDVILRSVLPFPARRILDCACGIGTQAVGLAGLGYAVTGTDLSETAVARAGKNSERLGTQIQFRQADFRHLEEVVPADYDAVLALENAISHLLEPEDILQAFSSMRSRLRPGGVTLVSTRDYDSDRAAKITGTAPRIMDDGNRLAFQAWEWQSTDVYRLRYFLMSRQPEAQWTVKERLVRYRAWPRAELLSLAQAAGFVECRWLSPSESGYRQQLLLGYNPVS